MPFSPPFSPLELHPWPPNLPAIEASIRELIDSGDWSAYEGPATSKLAQRISADLGGRSVRLTPSGTAALEIALRACRLQPGDEVLLGAYDYPGNLRTVAAVSATPVLVDFQPTPQNPLLWTLSVDALEAASTPLTRVVIVSHLHQLMVDLQPIMEWADARSITVIEDACQSPGAMIDGKPAGSMGHLSTFSFGGSKLVTSGNGGAVVTDSPRLAQRMRIEIDRPSDVFPLSQLQAAAVLPQWESLPHWNAVRRNAAIAIITELAGAANIFRIPRWGASTLPALYKLAWLAPDESTRNAQLSRARLIGLPCGVPFPVFSGRNRATAEAARRPPISHALAMHREGIVMDHRALAAEPTEIIRRLRWVLDAAPGEDLENDIR